MEQHAADWRSPKSDGGVFEGFNDAGIETFTEHPVEKEGREAIQNALDPVKNPAEPVRVEIHLSELGPGEIPGAKTLGHMFDACISTIHKMADLNHDPSADKRALDFFNKAKLDLHSRTRLIRISDYNTTGLVGATDGLIGSPWYNLVKGRGLNNKGASAGGSFGIGKMASFACSRSRTVFYGTRVDGRDSYIGVTRLQSYATSWKDSRAEELFSGTGYYAQGTDMHAIPGPCPLRDTPRTEDGTDVYILDAMGQGDDILEDFRRAALMNFFITIYEKNLIVRLSDEAGLNVTISKATLGREISRLREREDTDETRDLAEYYDILRHEDADDPDTYLELWPNSDGFGKEFGFHADDCRLLLKKGDGLNRQILVTRRTGMRLFEWNRFSASQSFTGILRITGDAMNAVYREMEVPSHDKWNPDRCEDPRRKVRGGINYHAAYRNLRAQIGKLIEENCRTSDDGSVSAYGMEDFFLADETTVKEKETKAKAPAAPAKRKIRTKKQNPTTHRHVDPDTLGEQTAPGKKPDAQQPKGRSGGPHHPHDKEWSGPKQDVSMRVLPVDPMRGAYQIRFRAPRDKADAKIVLYGSPERTSKKGKGSYGLAFSAAQRDGQLLAPEGNELVLGPVEKGEIVTIQFTLALPGLFMMEANYYEAK